jgi:arylsulfatase A-like enzyme
VIVVTSDHGEEFAEKGVMNHGINLNASVLHVPLLVVLPDRRTGVRIRRPVSLRDLAATLLDLSRSRGELTDTLPGRSLASDLYAQGSSAAFGSSERDTLLAEMTGFRVRGTPNFRGHLASAITSSLHYVVDDAGNEDLFALESDWWEQESLAERAEYQDELQRLREWTRTAVLKLGRRTIPHSADGQAFPGRRIEQPQ